MTALRFRGRWADMAAADRRALLERSLSSDAPVVESVAAIIADVRTRGDDALRDLARRFDPSVPEELEVPRPLLLRALHSMEPTVRRAMERSLANIATVHRASLPSPVCVEPEPGVTIVRRPDPLARVGIYAPGGRAPYPSSVLMAAVPARVAGVNEIVLCSPPGPGGAPSSLVLAAAVLGGVDRVFAVGGAGAIAALAYGTKSVPPVDRIVGPGNAWVAEAKVQVAGRVGIDAPAGPSELLVIADRAASARVVATELLAQAEHDPSAQVLALCVSESLADEVEREIGAALDAQARSQIIRTALASNGGVLGVASLDEAVAIANSYAPEHLLLAGGATALEDRIVNAGAVFVGETSSVAFGDYLTGANHVLPTGGLARAWSGLSVDDFLRWTTIQRIDREAARRLADDTAIFAMAECLPGHAGAASQWGIQ